MKHYTIPVFIPELACPFQCVFCNQRKITGKLKVPAPEEVNSIIESYLETYPEGDKHVEIGFFGGNFTGIDRSEQEKYLAVARPFRESGKIQGIRLSTRPDYIDEDILQMLKIYGVTTIELGAQSMDEEVLIQAGRGHTAGDTREAAIMIREAGFELGLQMMIGLPGDTLEKSLLTAKEIIVLGATNTRIYPTLVIKGTRLEEEYLKGKYKPLELEEAVEWVKHILPLFEAVGVNVIRIGLHPSEGLLDGSELLAGPFHPSFRELVLTEIWWDLLSTFMEKEDRGNIEIAVAPGQINVAIGYEGKNRKRLLQKYGQVKFREDESLKGREYGVSNGSRPALG